MGFGGILPAMLLLMPPIPARPAKPPMGIPPAAPGMPPPPPMTLLRSELPPGVIPVIPVEGWFRAGVPPPMMEFSKASTPVHGYALSSTPVHGYALLSTHPPAPYLSPHTFILVVVSEAPRTSFVGCPGQV